MADQAAERVWLFIGKNAAVPVGMLLGDALIDRDVVQMMLALVAFAALRARTTYVFGECRAILGRAIDETRREVTSHG